MPISKEEVKYVANLARLGLTEDEISHFQTQLEEILQYIGKLQKVDISGIASTAHVLDIRNVLRPDDVKASLDPKKILGMAPSREGDFYKVPKVIE